MRLFFAIELDERLRSALTAAQRQLYDLGIRGNATRPENLHLTLAFIGEYPDPDAVLEAACGLSFPAFPLSLGGLGTFDGVLWAGIEENPALAQLARQLRHALAEAQIPYDKKRFSPHLTLIRKPEGLSPEKLRIVRVPAAEMVVREISLMRSTRGKNGMIYTRLGGVPAN